MAQYGYRMPPIGDPTRAEFIRKLFLPVKDQQRYKRDWARLCDIQGEYDIKWELFSRDWDLASVKSMVARLFADPTVEVGYVGVTGCPIWRWRLCRNHTDGFRAHADEFDKMFVIMCERGEPIQVLEEDLIEMIRCTPCGKKLRNSKRYVAGTMAARQVGFLYVCVKECEVPMGLGEH